MRTRSIKSSNAMILPALRAFIAAAGLATLTLASCMVGPDYQRPAVETPAGFKGAATQPSTQPSTQPASRLGRDWWRLFGDPNLTRLEEQAGEANQDLKAAMARVAQARAIVQSTRSQLFPTLTLDPSVTRARTAPGRSGRASTDTRVQIPFDLTYEVDIWGRVRRATESSRAQLLATTLDVEVIRQTLQADVAINYFSLRSLDAQAEIVDRNIALFRRQVEITQKQFKVGLVSKTDMLQAQAQLEGTATQAIELRRQRADVEHALAVLVGRPPSELSVEILPLDLEPPSIPSGLPAELLSRRPDVAEAEANLVAANAQVGVAKA
ncbi:MAG: efflux transporter outer membrane subunit, partial [Planctomycetota bacterium]|nr:efflux transporter outer membrane subunit [Planctomycetota bacterium]